MERRRRRFVLIGVLLVSALVAGSCAESYPPQKNDAPQKTEEPTTEYTSDKGVRVTVDQPLAEAVVESPLEVKGRAPGAWSFEADFPIEILDADRQRVVEGYATMQGEWMTEDDVDFLGEVEFEPPASATGFVVLRRANPSGLKENDDAVEIPVRFEP
jgi:hypothetical protein